LHRQNTGYDNRPATGAIRKHTEPGNQTEHDDFGSGRQVTRYTTLLVCGKAGIRIQNTGLTDIHE